MVNKKGLETNVNTTEFTRFDAWFKQYATQFGIDWLMLKAFCMNESSLGTHKSVAHGLLYPNDIEGSKSEDGLSWGIMQFVVKTARDFDPAATEAKLNNPEYSIKLAARFVAWLYNRFDVSDPRRTEWVIKSYNQGAGNANRERRGEIDGYADEYFERFLRNYNKAKQGAK